MFRRIKERKSNEETQERKLHNEERKLVPEIEFQERKLQANETKKIIADQKVITPTRRKYVNVKERIKKYSEKINSRKENLIARKNSENYSFSTLENYFKYGKNLKSDSIITAAETGFEPATSPRQNFKNGCKGLEATERIFVDGNDLTRLGSRKAALGLKVLEPRYASPGKRKFIEEKENSQGSGKRTKITGSPN